MCGGVALMALHGGITAVVASARIFLPLSRCRRSHEKKRKMARAFLVLPLELVEKVLFNSSE